MIDWLVLCLPLSHKLNFHPSNRYPWNLSTYGAQTKGYVRIWFYKMLYFGVYVTGYLSNRKTKLVQEKFSTISIEFITKAAS